MKKVFLLLLLLSGCMNAPQNVFQTNTYTEIPLNVSEVETVSMVSAFDELPHIEQKMSLSPEEAIIQWSQKYLLHKGDKKKMVILIRKAEMLLEEEKNSSWFKANEETYTLNYQVEIRLQEDKRVIKKSTVEGKGFITLGQKSSLAKKEKGWNWLIQKMITHLETKIQTDFRNEII